MRGSFRKERMYEMRRQLRGKLASLVAYDPSERPKACAVAVVVRLLRTTSLTEGRRSKILPKKKAMCGTASLILDHEAASE